MKLLSCFLVLSALPLMGWSQERTSYSADRLFSLRSPKGYIPSLVHNIGTQAAAPFHFSRKDWLYSGAAVATTAMLIGVDGEIDEWARTQKQGSAVVNYTSPGLSQLGSKAGIYGVLGFGALSALANNPKGLQTSLLASQAMITSGLWVHAFKLLSMRERPDQSYRASKLEGGRWYGPGNLTDKDIGPYGSRSSLNAFISGHTATAFSIATVFATEYRDSKIIPALSYTTASLVGLSRLTEHKHWASDVFAGAVIGYVCGKQVSRNFDRVHAMAPEGVASSHKPELSVFENDGQLGLRLTLR